jgi:hypothetical protein
MNFQTFLETHSTLPGPIGDFGKRVQLAHITPPAYGGRKHWARLVDRKLGIEHRAEFVAAWRAYREQLNRQPTEVTNGSIGTTI